MIIAEKQGANGQANAYAELTFTVTAGSQELIYTDVGGNELPKTQDKYNAYEEVYGKGKTFQLYTAGNPKGSVVTYALKSDCPTDVIQVQPNGQVTILNASLNTQMGKVIVEATSHDPTGNYTDKTIDLPITIKKAEQTVAFADVTYAVNGSGTVTPLINAQDISSNDGGVIVNDTSYYITVDTSIASGIAWTNDGINIVYNYSGDDGIDIPLHVEKQGNRNYNKATADGQMRIMGPDESTLSINVPGKITYGDHFTIKSLQDDSSSTNVQYTFTVDNTTYVSNAIVNGNIGEFDALKYSGNTETTIKVVRTADGEVALCKEIKIKVLPKAINITIDHQTKLFGEQNPPLTYQDFSSQLVSWNGVVDQILPGDIRISTTAKATSPVGSYPITGDSSMLNNKYTDYSFSFIDGTLTINEEEIQADWYHLELDDGNNTPYNGDCTNQDVNIISDHQAYTDVSVDKIAWNPNHATVVNEGSYPQSFWMKKVTGATTKEKQADVKIDKKAPVVKSIKEKTVKIKESITVKTDDSNGTLDVSDTKSIDIRITKQVQTRSNGNVIQDTIQVNQESASIVMDQSGTFEVCAIPTDNAGNTGVEKCETIKVKKIDYDEDGDKELDFNDPDGDGCPDLNIVLGKDDDGDWIKLNVDRNKDSIPELNIDSDGDGKADLNIVNVTTWQPTYCVLGQAEEYCTDQTLIPSINVDLDKDGRPDINVDLDGDGIPDIDIDTDGDGKLDINIDVNHDGTPDENLNKLSKWEIGKEVYEVNGQKFQTMPNLKPDGNDTLEDNGVKVEKPDGTPFLPNYALKVEDVTEREKEEVTSKVKEMIKDQEVKKVFDVKLLKDNTEVQPDGELRVKIPYQEIKNPILLRKNANGDYERVNFTIEDGYMIYETDELGIVSIIGDKETSVMGTYTPNVGGAITGDGTNIYLYFVLIVISLITMNSLKKRNTKNH